MYVHKYFRGGLLAAFFNPIPQRNSRILLKKKSHGYVYEDTFFIEFWQFSEKPLFELLP